MPKESRDQYRVNSLNLEEINRTLQRLGDRLDAQEGRRGTPEFKDEIRIVNSSGVAPHHGETIKIFPSRLELLAGVLAWMKEEDYFKFSDDIYLNNGECLIFDKAAGNGIRIDGAAPTFGWRDLRAEIRTRGVGATDPNDTAYLGSIKAYSFAVNDEAWIEFHLPHDYVSGTDIFLHFHWSHNSAIVTGGSITLGADVTYAKGHDQAPFSITVNPILSPKASIIQYQHMVSELQLSAGSPNATQINTADLEPDGLILARVYLSANNITSSGAVPSPFIHEVDIHYQSTNIATKANVPDFYA